MNSNLYNKSLFIFFSLFLLNCNKNEEKKKTLKINNITIIDSLLSKSYKVGLDNKTRNLYSTEIFKILNLRENDTLKRYYFFRLANLYYNTYENEKFKETINLIFLLSKKSNDSISIAKSFRYLGDYHYNIFKNDSAYFYYSKAEKINQKLKNKADLSDIQLYKANILLFEKDYVGCEVAIINILKTAISKNDYRLIYDCYITLANALDGLNDFEKSLEYYNKAFEITKKLATDSQYFSLKSQTYFYIGCLYNKNKEYKKAISYFTQGLKFKDPKSLEPFLYANFINNLAYSKFKLGNKNAIVQFNEAYKIRDSLKNIPGIVASKLNLSEYYLSKNDTVKAFNFANEAKNTAHVNNIFEDELKTLELLSKIDPKNNEFYDKRFIKLTDSLQTNERATRNKFARIEFETDEILVEKNTIEVEKETLSNQRWLILGSSLLVLIFVGLVYFSKMQHARNKQLQLEKEQQKANEDIYQLMLDQQSKITEGRNAEKKRISQELHDGIMSKLTSTRLNLFILSKKTDQETINKCLVHVDKIQDIEKEIRAISHDLANDVFLSKDSFKIIIEDLFENQAAISKLNYTLYIDPKIDWENIASTTKMNLYRIFQESLQNIRKYANAKNIDTKISKTENNIEIEIADDGQGFDVLKTKDGIGLKNMKSRSDFIKSELNVVSNIGLGTKINLLIPI